MADNPELVAELRGDNEHLKKTFADSEQAAVKTASVIERALAGIAIGFTPVTAVLRNAGEGFEIFGRLAAGNLKDVVEAIGEIPVAGVALAGVAKVAADEFTRLADVASAAAAVGITTDEYQKLAFALTEASVQESKQADALKNFAEQANFASRGFGDLFATLGKYDLQARQALAGTTDFGKQLGIVADAVARAAGEQRRGAIASAAFGKTTVELTEFLRGGADAIGEAADKAKDLNLIVSPADIQKAKELKDKFDDLAKTVDTELRQALVDAAPVILKVAQGLEYLGFMAGFSLKVIGKLGEGIVETFASMEGAATDTLTGRLDQARQQLEAINAEIERNAKNPPTIDLRDALGLGNVQSALDARKRAVEQYIADIQAILKKREQEPEDPDVKPPAFTRTPKPGTSEQDIARGTALLNSVEQDYLKATQQNTVLIQLEYENRLNALKKALDEGQIAYEDFTEAEVQLEAAATAKIQAEAVKKILPLTNAIQNNLGRAFDDLWENGKIKSGEFFNGLAKDIAKAALQMYVLQPLFGGGTTPAGGAVGGLLAGIFHEGGVAGEAGPSRMVSALAFARAPRFHDGGIAGLQPGEVPAILQSGERVLSRSETAAAAAGGSQTIVQIVNQSGGEVREERSRQGGTDYVRILIGAVRDDMSRGGFDNVMRGRFATPVATGRR